MLTLELLRAEIAQRLEPSAGVLNLIDEAWKVGSVSDKPARFCNWRRKREAHVIAFGRPFIANPDLVARFKHDLPLAKADGRTFYGGGSEGYIDWPKAS